MRKTNILLVAVFIFCGLGFTQDIPQEGLLAYYKFDEEGEAMVTDHSSSGLDGEIVGDAIYVEGVKGTALLFNGVDAYVNCTNATEFDIAAEITLMAWVCPNDLDDNAHSPWIAKGDHAYNLKNGNGPYKFEFDIYDGGWIWLNVFVDSTYTETWHHYAGTYDGYEQKMYVDGELRETQEHVGTINVTEHEVHLGHNAEASDRFYNGILDEVLIYDIALSEDDIEAVYNGYITKVEEHSVSLVSDFALHQNYPNPFNPVTKISYSLPISEFVEIKVYDMLGKEIRTLINETQAAGIHSVNFDATGLTSGVYFYKMQIGNKFDEIKKMLLVL